MQSVIALDEDVAIAFMKYTGQNWKASIIVAEAFTPAAESIVIYETDAIAIIGMGSLNAHISSLTALNTQGRGILETKWNSSVCLRLAHHAAVSRTASNMHLVPAISMYRHIKLDDLIGKKLSELGEVKLKEMHYVQIT